MVTLSLLIAVGSYLLIAAYAMSGPPAVPN